MLKKPLNIKNLRLNGKTIPRPMEGMSYTAIPGIPTSLLKKGSNELQAAWTEEIKTKKYDKTSKVSIVPGQINSADVDIRLSGLMPSALTFQTGPILGYAGETFFTVTCIHPDIPHARRKKLVTRNWLGVGNRNRWREGLDEWKQSD